MGAPAENSFDEIAAGSPPAQVEATETVAPAEPTVTSGEAIAQATEPESEEAAPESAEADVSETPAT